jgi:hypothetical protein
MPRQKTDKFIRRLRSEIGRRGTVVTKQLTRLPEEVGVDWHTDRGLITRQIDTGTVRDPGATAGLGAGMKREYDDRRPT